MKFIKCYPDKLTVHPHIGKQQNSYCGSAPCSPAERDLAKLDGPNLENIYSRAVCI